jgi:hypothetical protein
MRDSDVEMEEPVSRRQGERVSPTKHSIYQDNTEEERKKIQQDITNSPIPLNHKRKTPSQSAMRDASHHALPDNSASMTNPPSSAAMASSFHLLMELAQSTDSDGEGPSTPKAKFLVPLRRSSEISDDDSRASLKALLTAAHQRLLDLDSRTLEKLDVARVLSQCVSDLDRNAFLDDNGESTSPMELQFRRLQAGDSSLTKRRKIADRDDSLDQILDE